MTQLLTSIVAVVGILLGGCLGYQRVQARCVSLGATREVDRNS